MRNKKLVKMTAMAATAAMMMTLAAGCGNSGSDTSDKKEDTTTSKGGSTITIAASAGWVKDIDKELAAKYEEESGNTIEWQVSPDDQYENVLNSKLSVGEGADIFYIRSE